MISEDHIEKALDYLRDNATVAAQARANRIYVEEYRKTVKAQLMKKHAELPLGAQERDAYADPIYIQHLEAIKQAVEQDEYHRFMRSCAEAKITAWQTQSANHRAMKL